MGFRPARSLVFNGVAILAALPWLVRRSDWEGYGGQALTGLLLGAAFVGLAFDPDYTSNGFFYVHYQGIPTESVVARYHVTSNPDIADPNSATIILRTPRTAFGHNGGAINFSLDYAEEQARGFVETVRVEVPGAALH